MELWLAWSCLLNLWYSLVRLPGWKFAANHAAELPLIEWIIFYCESARHKICLLVNMWFQPWLTHIFSPSTALQSYMTSLTYLPGPAVFLQSFLGGKNAIIGSSTFSSDLSVRSCWAELKYGKILAVGGGVLSYDFSKLRKPEYPAFLVLRFIIYVYDSQWQIMKGCLQPCSRCICRATLKPSTV